jgi:hypothetical protein
MTEEHEVLAEIFKDAFDKIQTNYDAGKLPHARTSVLPHILTLAENILMPLLAKSKNDENYEGQLFAISATFRWTIKRLMPIEKFMEHMQSDKMEATDSALEDLTTRVGGVTKEDIDERMGADKAKRSFPGVG